MIISCKIMEINVNYKIKIYIFNRNKRRLYKVCQMANAVWITVGVSI